MPGQGNAFDLYASPQIQHVPILHKAQRTFFRKGLTFEPLGEQHLPVRPMQIDGIKPGAVHAVIAVAVSQRQIEGQGGDFPHQGGHVAPGHAGVDHQRPIPAGYYIEGIVQAVGNFPHPRRGAGNFIKIQPALPEHPGNRLGIPEGLLPGGVGMAPFFADHSGGIFDIFREGVAAAGGFRNRQPAAVQGRVAVGEGRAHFSCGGNHRVVRGVIGPQRHPADFRRAGDGRAAAHGHDRGELSRITPRQIPRAHAAHGQAAHIQPHGVSLQLGTKGIHQLRQKFGHAGSGPAEGIRALGRNDVAGVFLLNLLRGPQMRAAVVQNLGLIIVAPLAHAVQKQHQRQVLSFAREQPVAQGQPVFGVQGFVGETGQQHF